MVDVGLKTISLEIPSEQCYICKEQRSKTSENVVTPAAGRPTPVLTEPHRERGTATKSSNNCRYESLIMSPFDGNVPPLCPSQWVQDMVNGDTGC